MTPTRTARLAAGTAALGLGLGLLAAQASGLQQLPSNQWCLNRVPGQTTQGTVGSFTYATCPAANGSDTQRDWYDGGGTNYLGSEIF